jgi:MFS family permease
MPRWMVALAVVLVLQTLAAYLTRLVPVLSPAFMAEFGWEESWIGYLTAANMAGAMCMLAGGMGLLRRMGGLLLLQASIFLGAAALLLFQFPYVAAALLASVLIGLSNGTGTPAGSAVLIRHRPAAHHNLVFSIRQAGVPLGGVAAGLAIPLLADWGGWRSALLVSALVTLALTALLLPLRRPIESPREPAPLRWPRLRDIGRPLRAAASSPELLRVTLVGGIFAIAQAAWFAFAVTYLVVALGYPLALAGLVFAVMQAASVVGRIALGLVADRASSEATLAVVAVLSAAATALFGLATPDWPLWSIMLLSAVGGATVSGWNGVQVAEVTRRAPRELLAEAVAGSTIVVFASNMLAPLLFAAFVAATRRFDIAFAAAGACSLLCLPLLLRRPKTRRA